MVKKDTEAAVAVAEVEIEGRTIAPFEGGNNLFAAWDKFYWIFGLRANPQLSPEGVFLTNFTAPEELDVSRLLQDINRTNHRIDLIPHSFWLTEVPPQPFDAKDISQFLMQWWAGSEKGGKGKKTPEYPKEWIAAYKKKYGFVTRGKGKAATLKLDPLDPSKFDPSVLSAVPEQSLEAYQKMISDALLARHANDLLPTG